MIRAKDLIKNYNYIITKPNYDDDPLHSSEIVKVLGKLNYGIRFINIKSGEIYEMTYQHLLTCDISLYEE